MKKLFYLGRRVATIVKLVLNLGHRLEQFTIIKVPTTI